MSEGRNISGTKVGDCEVCGVVALLDKGFGKKYACEKCYYEIGNNQETAAKELKMTKEEDAEFMKEVRDEQNREYMQDYEEFDEEDYGDMDGIMTNPEACK